MPNHLPSPARRRLLGSLASLPVLGWAGVSRAASLPPGPAEAPVPPKLDDPTMLVPGPNGGTIARWARLMQPALAQSLSPGTVFRQTIIGGADGVTAANRFEARGTLDGLTLLMAPGEAALAWLMGDPRAKFDVSRWVAVLATLCPAVVVGRPGALATGRPVRVAGTPGGSDLPAILGLDLLGVRAKRVRGVDDKAVPTAFAQGAIDAVLLRGHKVPQQAQAMAQAGMQPLFALGLPGKPEHLSRAPAFPDLPSLDDLYRNLRGANPTGPLFAAWRAAAIASQLEFGLVLPELTPAPMVALWRQAGVQAMAALDIRALVVSLALEPVSGPAATACGDLWSPRMPALLALRAWLSKHYDWRPV